MRDRTLPVLLCLSAAMCLAQTAITAEARQQEEIERIRELVNAGALPRVRLEEAERQLEDLRDRQVLDRVLYGGLTVEDLTEEQADEMVAAARRRLERQEKAYKQALELVEAGARARASTEPLLEELNFRRQTLQLAEERASLFRELVAQAANEKEVEEQSTAAPVAIAERYDGNGIFHEGHLRKIEAAFGKKFDRPLPISARGTTAVHRALGFDHRNRVDVALNPDQPEGVWLRQYLEAAKIPYFAFRAAIAGKATAPHIHIGLPSGRLRASD